MKKELKIGIIVVLTVGLAYWGIGFLKGLDFFDKKKIYHANYENIMGVTVSNPVLFHGFKVGQVTEISVVENPQNGKRLIDVEFVITNPNIQPTDSTIARIISSDILGSRAINLEGIETGNPITSGGIIKGSVEKELKEIVNEQILPLKKSAEKLIESVEQLVGTFKAIMNDDTKNHLLDAFEKIPSTIKNLESATSNIDTTVKVSGEKLKLIFANIESITSNLKKSNSKVDNIISNLSMVSDSLAKADIAQILLQVEQVMTKANAIVAKISRGEGSLGLLVNDETLYRELMLAAARFNMLVVDLENNPERYINFSLVDFRKGQRDLVGDSAQVKRFIKQDSTLFNQICK